MRRKCWPKNCVKIPTALNSILGFALSAIDNSLDTSPPFEVVNSK